MSNTHTPIAITAMAGIYPGALNLEQFWQNIAGGVSAISDKAHLRWNIDPHKVLSSTNAPDKALHANMGLAPEFTLDTNGLELDAGLIAEMDPMYRLLLQTGQNLFKGAKFPVIDRETTGLILAAIALPTEKSSALAQAVFAKELEHKSGLKLPGFSLPQNTNEALAALVTSLPAALFTKAFGLGGINYTLDAACASSLFAVKLACDELIAGRCRAMLAGGLSRPDSLYTQIGFTQLKALSKSGVCAPFDAKADGLVVGEGCGLVVLKRLNDALADGDEILAVIRGIGTSNDMEGTLLAPASEGQLRAMTSVYSRTGLKPNDIDLIECHGAGTPLGDKTELNSLEQLWQNDNFTTGQCALGSIKSMTGHLLTAAGMAGLMKTILAMRNATIPPSLNFATPPPNTTALTTGPFYVPVKAAPWPRRNAKTTRKAAVSAFGFGGTNAHLLLEEWDAQLSGRPENPQAYAPEPVVIVGMGVYAGNTHDLTAYKQRLFQDTAWPDAPASLLKRERQKLLLGGEVRGYYVDKLEIGLQEFHITPNEIPDILPQHLLLMKAAKAALQDAGLDLRAPKARMGAVAGMDYDFGANDFCVRWLAQNLNDDLLPAYLTASQKQAYKNQLADYCAKPLTHNRVLGHLGGIIAARLAKEFKLGALCGAISSSETGGLSALHIAVNALRNHDADSYLACAVDLPGDTRQMLLNRLLGIAYSNRDANPFDKRHDGTNPGEGAVCLVLKRLKDAVNAGDRIYAVLDGTAEFTAQNALALLPAATATSGNNPTQSNFIELVMTNADGNPESDNMVAEALSAGFPGQTKTTALCSSVSHVGNTGAAAGLFTVAETVLSLYHKILPGIRNYISPAATALNGSALHLPQKTVYWAHNTGNGPRLALCYNAGKLGHNHNLLLKEHVYGAFDELPEQVKLETTTVLGVNPVSLFAVTGDNVQALQNQLSALQNLAADYSDLSALARRWHSQNGYDAKAKLALAFYAKDREDFDILSMQAADVLKQNRPVIKENLWFNPKPQWSQAPVTFMYPGSGNQFLGMGRTLNLRFPVMRQQYDYQNGHLKDEMVPQLYMPYVSDWSPGFEKQALSKVKDELVNFIFGQAAYSVGMHHILRALGITPNAVAGYSLGESAAMFATHTWHRAFEMIRDMQASDLFTTQLFGPCLAFRKAFNVPTDYPFKWAAVWLHCAHEKAAQVIADYPYTTMMIVDTPDECVIGGDLTQLKEVIARLDCRFVFLHGVAAVHCKAVEPVQDTYLRLHTRRTTPVKGLTYYSCGWAKAYEPTDESVGRALLQQIVHGFDFSKLVEQMYADGQRIFVEVGPGHSLTRIMDKILDEKPHLALSASSHDESEDVTIARLLGRLISERIPVDPAFWFAHLPQPTAAISGPQISLAVGATGVEFPMLPAKPKPIATTPPKPAAAPKTQQATTNQASDNLLQNLLARQMATNTEVSAAHEKFLALSAEITQNMAQALTLKAGTLANIPDFIPAVADAPIQPPDMADVICKRDAEALFPREMCLEFARGLAQNVLGPEFAEIDDYEVRVRLPDEPLMLVDRIMEVTAQKGKIGAGSMITEHDVKPGAWYLDGGHAPVCIAVEAGQADLFLSAYMGIDLLVKGKRAYRLLDAVVEFHRELPVPGEIIAYHINIERFLKHGETYIFFFNFTGYIGEQRLITMTNGCAGFFTKEEVENSGGILQSDLNLAYKDMHIQKNMPLHNLVTMQKEAYSDASLDKLRRGDAEGCFGPQFQNITIPPNLRLASGQMHLLDRVLEINPAGGRWGLGHILGEADILGGEWFLECHFVDDKVMPGTLMYECCAHTLKVFLQRMGWLCDNPAAYYGTKMGVRSKLKCRGPVTTATKKVTYELEIKEVGLEPHPYVIADAFMYADGHRTVWFQDMPMQLCHATFADIEAFWAKAEKSANLPAVKPAPLFTREQLLEYILGSPSRVFGEIYKPYDVEKYLARLPQPPFLFIDRITATEATPFKLETGHKFTSEVDVKAEDWYFKADHNPVLPLVCLMEIALQPCGFSTVYMGTALLNDKPMYFRNLSGNMRQYHAITQKDQTLAVESTLTKCVKAKDMILVTFDFAVKATDGSLYCDGDSTFGFFTKEQLQNQKGFTSGDIMETMQPPANRIGFDWPQTAPLTPFDTADIDYVSPALPGGGLSMLDKVECLSLTGGSQGLGFVKGSQQVDPKGWFFEAHFPLDPVCPGSLGIEAMVQLLKAYMLERFPGMNNHVFCPVLNNDTVWDYRGQILRHNQTITIMADITAVNDAPFPQVFANAVLLADGLHIYTCKNLGLSLRPHTDLD